jgi:hypothetical protein
MAYFILQIFHFIFSLILGASRQELEASEQEKCISLNLDEMNRQWREQLIAKKPMPGDDDAKEQGTASANAAENSIAFIECETNSEHSLLGASDQTIGILFIYCRFSCLDFLCPAYFNLIATYVKFSLNLFTFSFYLLFLSSLFANFVVNCLIFYFSFWFSMYIYLCFLLLFYSYILEYYYCFFFRYLKFLLDQTNKRLIASNNSQKAIDRYPNELNEVKLNLVESQCDGDEEQNVNRNSKPKKKKGTNKSRVDHNSEVAVGFIMTTYTIGLIRFYNFFMRLKKFLLLNLLFFYTIFELVQIPVYFLLSFFISNLDYDIDYSSENRQLNVESKKSSALTVPSKAVDYYSMELNTKLNLKCMNAASTNKRLIRLFREHELRTSKQRTTYYDDTYKCEGSLFDMKILVSDREIFKAISEPIVRNTNNRKQAKKLEVVLDLNETKNTTLNKQQLKQNKKKSGLKYGN